MVAAGLVVVSACGGSDSTPVTPTTTQPTPPPPRTVLSGGTTLAVNYAVGAYFTVDRAGTVEATVDYTYATSQIFVWIARGQCTPELFPDQCTYVASSFAGAKPRRVSATGAVAGTYTLIVGNAGPDDESISYQVVLTPTAGTASPGAASLPTGQPSRWILKSSRQTW
jgi:hypothetical protein